MIERRLATRHRARTKVRVECGGQSKMCKAKNLSAHGCLVETDGMRLTPGMTATLTFAVVLSNIVKLHRRTATVVHVTGGCTGFSMGRYDA